MSLKNSSKYKFNFFLARVLNLVEYRSIHPQFTIIDNKSNLRQALPSMTVLTYWFIIGCKSGALSP